MRTNYRNIKNYLSDLVSEVGFILGRFILGRLGSLISGSFGKWGGFAMTYVNKELISLFKVVSKVCLHSCTEAAHGQNR
jgi:hypothetical protein